MPPLRSPGGPLDGSYQVTETFPNSVQISYYVIALQNGNQVGIVSLFPPPVLAVFPQSPEWTWGLGTLGSDGIVGGYLYLQDGSTYGAFAATILPDGSIVAAASVNGVISQIQGFRFF